MKTNFNFTPVALAIVAFAASPAFASGGGNNDNDHHQQPTSSATAVVVDGQVSAQNTVSNYLSTNDSSLSGNALNSAAGNIGVNVATGDNNQQANAAAISAADASLVFGSTDALVGAYQQASQNTTTNNGQTNRAGISGDAMANASGNIGVNMAAGNSNQQKNDMAIATGTSTNGTAVAGALQMNANNNTTNSPVSHQEVQNVDVNLALNATGTYQGGGFGGYAGGTSGTYHGTQSSNNHDNHGNSMNSSSNNNDHNTTTESGSYHGSESGLLGFAEAGNQTLSGTVTGSIPVVVVTNVATTNTAYLGDNALASAAGNIGVNVASGTNNQQFNGLAVASVK